MVFHKTDWNFAENKIRDEIRQYFKGFIYKKSNKIDFTINFVEKRYFISKKDRLGNQFVVIFEKKSESMINTYYQIGFIQFQFILREIINNLLAENQGYILHASAVSHGNKAYIFLGKPTAGKSTIVRLLSKKYKPFADDSVYVKKINNRLFLFQTPMVEKETIENKSSKKYSIERIFFLIKGKRFFIEKINNKKKTLQLIIGQLITTTEVLKKQLPQLIDFINKNDLFFNLIFSKRSKIKLDNTATSKTTIAKRPGSSTRSTGTQ